MILLVGGAGYIGTHAAVALLEKGIDIIVYDNLSNSTKGALKAVRMLTGKDFIFVHGDIRDASTLDAMLSRYKVEAVMHFAGLKSVPVSISQPLLYYDNNVTGTLTLLEALSRHNVYKLIFSSSASVYGAANRPPYREDMPIGKCSSPYGQTKAAIEFILESLAISDSAWGIAALRYFNAVGAHESGEIGESPLGTPGNLCPLIAQVAVGRLPVLDITGNDFDTPDGTGVRDYIHILDLVEGHIAALDYLSQNRGYHAFNLGTGEGVSVLEMLETFRSVSGKTIPARIAPRRPGDLAWAYADPTKANKLLRWKAQKSVAAMVEDLWRWQSSHPMGYNENQSNNLIQ